MIKKEFEIKLIHPELSEGYCFVLDFSECEKFINIVLEENE